MLYLLKRGMERKGNKLLGLGAVAAISDVEGGLVAVVTLPETGNAWPRDSDGAGTREERDAGYDVGEKREGKKLLRT